MEDDLKKKWKKTSKKKNPYKKMEDVPKKNGRRPKKQTKNEDDIKKINNRRRPKKNEKNEDDIKKKKNLFSIPLKFRANLSWDWLSSLRFLLFIYSVNIKPPRHHFGFSLAWGWQKPSQTR
jgi:hypothetical protein